MTFKIKHSLLAASLAIGLAAGMGSSQAATTALDSSGSFSAMFKSAGNVEDTITFSLPSLSDISGEYGSYGSYTIKAGAIKPVGDWKSFSFNLFSGTPGSATLVPLTQTSSADSSDYNYTFSAAGLSAGSYFLKLSGTTWGTNASYAGYLNITPVPEPESYAMFLAGLGLMGAVARRRIKKS